MVEGNTGMIGRTRKKVPETMPETTEWFNFGNDSIAVRVLERENMRWMPVADIASAIEYDRGGLTRILDNNGDLFSGMKEVVVATTTGGSKPHVCLNKEGIIGLLMKLNYTRIKNPEKQKRILDFQKWAIKILSDLIEGKKVAVHRGGDVASSPQKKRVTVTAAVREGKQIAREARMDARDCVSRSLQQYGYGYYVDLLPPSHVLLPPRVGQHSFAKSQKTLAREFGFSRDLVISGDPERPLIDTISHRNMIAPSPKPEGMLSATDIAERTKLSPAQVNIHLSQYKDLIIKDGVHPGEWRITEKGKEFGCEVPYRPTPDAPEVYRVYWYPKILEKFNVKV